MLIYCSNAIKVTDFKFDIHVPRDTPDLTPLKFSEKRACMARDHPSFLRFQVWIVQQGIKMQSFRLTEMTLFVSGVDSTADFLSKA